MDPQSTTAAASGTATVEPTTSTPADGATAPNASEGRQEPVAVADQGAAGQNPTTAGQTQARAPGESVEDWQRRFNGLQGVYNAEKTASAQRLQQAQDAQRQAEERAQRAESVAYDAQWRLQGLSPEQIRDNKAVLAERQRLQSEDTRLKAERVRFQDEQTAFRQATDPVARRIVAQQISEEFGVPVERIAHLSHPDLMRELAKELRGVTREGNLNGRKAQGTDKAESGGRGGIDFRHLPAHEQIKLGLKQHHSQAARR